MCCGAHSSPQSWILLVSEPRLCGNPKGLFRHFSCVSYSWSPTIDMRCHDMYINTLSWNWSATIAYQNLAQHFHVLHVFLVACTCVLCIVLLAVCVLYCWQCVYCIVCLCLYVCVVWIFCVLLSRTLLLIKTMLLMQMNWYSILCLLLIWYWHFLLCNVNALSLSSLSHFH